MSAKLRFVSRATRGGEGGTNRDGSAPGPLIPPPVALEHRRAARQPLVRRRVAPVLRCFDQAASHRIEVQIPQLLEHRLIAADRLRMRALLPDLMRAVPLVRGLEELELAQQPLPALGPELLEDAPRGEAFQITEHAAQLGRGEHRVEMVVEDHPAVDAQRLVLAAVAERGYEDVSRRGAGEDGEPLDDRGGDEVRKRLVMHAVTAAHGGA